PLEYRARDDGRRDYLRLLVEEMLPAVAGAGLARFADVFCEPGVYTTEESRVLLEAARTSGLGLKLHADELETSGGAELAAALGDRVGQLAPGFSADLALFDAEDVRELAYWYGDRLCRGTWVRGVACHPFEPRVTCAAPAPEDASPTSSSEPQSR